MLLTTELRHCVTPAFLQHIFSGNSTATKGAINRVIAQATLSSTANAYVVLTDENTWVLAKYYDFSKLIPVAHAVKHLLTVTNPLLTAYANQDPTGVPQTVSTDEIAILVTGPVWTNRFTVTMLKSMGGLTAADFRLIIPATNAPGPIITQVLTSNHGLTVTFTLNHVLVAGVSYEIIYKNTPTGNLVHGGSPPTSVCSPQLICKLATYQLTFSTSYFRQRPRQKLPRRARRKHKQHRPGLKPPRRAVLAATPRPLLP